MAEATRLDGLAKTRWLWSQRRPIAGTIAERYLRDARGITCPLPATLGFMPPHGEYPLALIAAFGIAHETEPGVIAIADDAVCGVHITRLLPDGSDRERADEAHGPAHQGLADMRARRRSPGVWPAPPRPSAAR